MIEDEGVPPLGRMAACTVRFVMIPELPGVRVGMARLAIGRDFSERQFPMRDVGVLVAFGATDLSVAAIQPEAGRRMIKRGLPPSGRKMTDFAAFSFHHRRERAGVNILVA